MKPEQKSLNVIAREFTQTLKPSQAAQFADFLEHLRISAQAQLSSATSLVSNSCQLLDEVYAAESVIAVTKTSIKESGANSELCQLRTGIDPACPPETFADKVSRS